MLLEKITGRMDKWYEGEANRLITYYRQEKERIQREIKEEAQREKIEQLTNAVRGELKSLQQKQRSWMLQEIDTEIRCSKDAEEAKAIRKQKEPDITMDDMYFIGFMMQNASGDQLVKVARRYKDSPKAHQMLSTYQEDDSTRLQLQDILNETPESEKWTTLKQQMESGMIGEVIYTAGGHKIDINSQVPIYSPYF